MTQKFSRAFTIDIGDPKDSPEWQSLRDVPIKQLQGCSFGFAEEVIGLVEWEDGVFTVGIGESMRPYHPKYEGTDAEEASKAFVQQILELQYDESEESEESEDVQQDFSGNILQEIQA